MMRPCTWKHCVGLLLWLLLCYAQLAQADPRFVVLLDAQKAADSLDGQIRQALPRLWDRLLPVAMRTGEPFVAEPRALLQRVQRSKRHISIELNEAAVWRLLQEQGIPALSEVPRFHLHLMLLNVQGKEMRNSQRLLAREAAEIARRWGIVLDPDASSVNMRFEWLDAQHVRLRVDGSALLSVIEEERRIRGDAFAFLRKWLRDTLLRLRDGQMKQGDPSSTQPVAPALKTSLADPYQNASDAQDLETMATELPQDGEVLVIRKPMPLSQQLLLEKDMRKERRVRSLIPLSFGPNEIRYILRMETDDQTWLTEWFARHGMRATRLDRAWLIQ